MAPRARLRPFAVLLAGLPQVLPSSAANATNASETSPPTVDQSGLLLSENATIAVVALGCAVALLACACCAVALRKPTRGTLRIKALGGQMASYVVETEKANAVATDVTDEVSETSPAPRKKKVVWSVDMPKVQAALDGGDGGHSAAAAGVAEDSGRGAGGGGMAEVGHPVAPPAGDPGEDSRRGAADGDVAEAGHPEALPAGDPSEDLLPMYEDGTECEYFSSTHSKWLTGAVSSHVVPTDQRRVLEYTCQILRGPARQNVPVDAFRIAPKPGEAVEVWCPPSLRWAPAVVQGRPGVTQTLMGYAVRRADPSGQAVGRHRSGVPAEWLRRLYHVGERVYVYRGEAQGWALATVLPDDRAAGDAADAPEPLTPFSPNWVALPEEEEDAPEDVTFGGPEGVPEGVPHPWRYFRVAVDGGAPASRVPSYLLRRGVDQV